MKKRQRMKGWEDIQNAEYKAKRRHRKDDIRRYVEERQLKALKDNKG